MGHISGKWAYHNDQHDLGNGGFAYHQLDGSWGWSDSALVVSREQSRAAQRIGTPVNTHSNGDHYFGNELVGGAEIIATKACDDEMRRDGGAGRLAEMKRNAGAMGETGEYFARIFGPFDFEGIN